MTMYLLETTILPNIGTYKLSNVTFEEAREIASQAVSAMWCEPLARYLSELLELPISVQKTVKMDPGDIALIFTVYCRTSFMQDLTLKELPTCPAEKLLECPFSLFKLERIE